MDSQINSGPSIENEENIELTETEQLQEEVCEPIICNVPFPILQPANYQLIDDLSDLQKIKLIAALLLQIAINQPSNTL